MVKMDYVWDRTVEFLGDHLSAVLPFAVAGLLVPTALTNALAPLWGGAGPPTRVAIALISVAAAIAVIWGYLAITALVLDPALRTRAGGVAARRLLPSLGIFLVLTLGVVALYLPMGVFAAYAGMDVVAMQTGRSTTFASPVSGWSLALYALALLAVLMVVAGRLLPLAAVIATERRGIGAVARAWRLTRGMTMRLIGVAILYFLVSQVAVLAVRTVFGSILRFVSPGDGPVTIGGVVTAIVVAAVSAAFTTLSAVFAAKLYLAASAAAVPVVADPEATRS